MLKQEKQVKEITIKRRYCDDCTNELNHTMACSVAQCEICRKDLCEKCIGFEDNTTGDYRTVYCKKCWTIGEEYRTLIDIHESEIEGLYNEWHEKCKK